MWLHQGPVIFIPNKDINVSPLSPAYAARNVKLIKYSQINEVEGITALLLKYFFVVIQMNSIFAVLNMHIPARMKAWPPAVGVCVWV